MDRSFLKNVVLNEVHRQRRALRSVEFVLFLKVAFVHYCVNVLSNCCSVSASDETKENLLLS